MSFFIDISDDRNQVVYEILKGLNIPTFIYLKDVNQIREKDVIVFSPAKKFEYQEVLLFPNNLTIYSGQISQDISNLFIKKKITHKNFLQDEEFALNNAKLTGEGVLALILSESKKSIFESKVLFLGGGRITKSTAILLNRLSVYTGIASFTLSEYYNAMYYSNIAYFENSFINDLDNFDVIVNTRPLEFFTQEYIKKVQKDTLFIETASKKCLDDSKPLNFKYLLAPKLPQRFSCYSAGKIIAEKILKDYNG